ncbi:23S rRNA (guanosine(2251)-2'-O)-methyltransferase RlmB [Chitinibacteraceae bacterium HSL-7]
MQKKILVGFHAVSARVKRFPDSVVELYISTERNDVRARELMKAADAMGVRYVLVDDKRIDGLAGNPRHQGVVAVFDASRSYVALDDVLDTLDEPAFLLVLDGVTDPHNLGACLRVADAMGVHAVVAPKDKAVGLNATVSKVACGAAETVPYVMVTNLARSLRDIKDRGIWIAGTAADADTDLFHLEAGAQAMAWVLGSEGSGMRRLTREHCDVLVSIPMFGSVESLNVSVASGIVLSETRRQRELAKR